MTTRPYIRNSLARSLYEKVLKDQNLRAFDKSKWYDCDVSCMDPQLQDLFILNHADQDTEDFIEQCFEKSDWVVTQLFHALARSFLCWFMTRTSVNGLLGRGSMFVFSNTQFESLLVDFDAGTRERLKSCGNLLDLGAGDGKVTDVMATHFGDVYVTEISLVMRKILGSKAYKVLEVDSWWRSEDPLYFDVISCLNLLDRCDCPITLLQQMRKKLNPETGILILAVVLPLSQYVESGTTNHEPIERIQIEGKTFEEQVSSLSLSLFPDNGFQVLRWTRLPYLCEGDLDQAFYWLNDAVFVLKVTKHTCEAS